MNNHKGNYHMDKLRTSLATPEMYMGTTKDPYLSILKQPK